MSSDTSQPDPLLAEIEHALDLYGISATKFGYMVCGDPALLNRMRKGVRPRKRRADIEAALKRLAEKGTL
jgi:uncharacterized protein (UPF0297 family)